MTNLPQNPEVIVIGAGTAGLSAAKALREARLKVLVLEAAAHIGGRCVTDTTTFDTPFDRGGSWLHAASINPLARIAEAQGAQLHKGEWDWTHLHVNGAAQPPEEVDIYRAYGDGMWDVINARGGQAPDVSIDEALPEGRWRDTARCWVPAMVGGDADVTSARDSHLYAEAEGDWLIAGGLGAFIARLHGDVPVMLNCPVTKIDTTGKKIRVETPKGTAETPHVILTVSTGVLGAESIRFDPPLPDTKKDAIAALPNGLLNKVGLEFAPSWQEAQMGDMADYHAGGEAFCSIAFGFYNTSLAVGFMAGRFAAALENEGPGTLTDFCLEALSATYGSAACKHVRKTDETAWWTNPLTFGAYSYARPGQSGARRVLAEPLDDRLFFAGEATMVDSYSTVHGAYLSGQRAAEQVIAARP